MWRLIYESVKMNPKLRQKLTLPTTALKKYMRIGIIGIAIISQSQYEKHINSKTQLHAVLRNDTNDSLWIKWFFCIT